MSSDWEALLVSRFGRQHVENCFADTNFAPVAAEFGFGLFVIRNAMSSERADNIQEELHTSIEEIGKKKGLRSIQAKAQSRTLYYNTIQVVSGICMCKYNYATTAKHPLLKVKEVPALDKATSWLKKKCRAPPEQMFNEIVANEYSRNQNEAIGWHTDKNSLLANCTDILSLSLGASGVFCYQPDSRSEHFEKFQLCSLTLKEGEKRKQMINAGLRGFVPVFSGDILLMSGTFQEYLVHKTLRFKTEEKSVLAKYPGSNASSKFLLRSALSSGLRFDRACITWRLIKYHKSDCPEMPSFPLPSMVGSSARQVDLVVDLGQTQNVRHKRLKSDSAQAQDVRQNLDSDTVIRCVRGSVRIFTC